MRATISRRACARSSRSGRRAGARQEMLRSPLAVLTRRGEARSAKRGRSRAVRVARGAAPDCVFCRVVRAEASAAVVFENPVALAFLDHRPLFPGHVLVVPRAHVETLADLTPDLVGPLFGAVQLLARAVERGVPAEGTFVAINNRISQSVPHLHVHAVPRRRGDGLRGFFWPRGRYHDLAQMTEMRDRLRAAVGELDPASP